MSMHLKILTAQYLDDYSGKVSIEWLGVFNELKKRTLQRILNITFKPLRPIHQT